jgi:DNA-binding winged helix-turn-helix (wHTH) protein/TolB-like protein/Tfp pilus assembly protein PilF
MEKKAKPLYGFGEFQLDCGEKLLRRGEAVVPLKAKVYDLLVLLVENAGRLLEKEWLMGELWPESFVEEVNLNVQISSLRKALGESATEHRYIETVPKRGYRFVARVIEMSLGGAPEPAALDARKAEFIQSDIAEERLAPAEPVTAPAAGDAHPNLELAAPVSESSSTAEVSRGQTPARRIPLWQVAAAVFLLAGVGVSLYLMWSGKAQERAHENLKSVAVLPFKALSKDETDGALAIGMADAIITKIGSLKKINVRPTSAVLKYSDTAEDSIAIGKQLQVDAILEGLVQKSDKRVRITAKLIRVEDGSPLWSDTFDDYFTNIFALQDSISEKMAQALSVQMTESEHRLLARRYTENTEAYQLYLLGQYHFYTLFDQDHLNQAESYYQAAVDKDAEFAPAWVGLADVYYTNGESRANRQAMRDKAKNAVNKALSIDANLPEALGTLSVLKLTDDFDWAEAERLIKRAIELKPNDGHHHESYARLLTQLGRCDEAAQEIRLALQYDPASESIRWSNCHLLAMCHLYDEAIAMAKRFHMEEISRQQWFYLNLQIDASKSEFNQAIAEAEKLDAQSSIVKRNNILAYCYARLGNRPAAEAILKERLKHAEETGVVSNAYNTAMIYVGMGEKERAFEYLEKSYREKEYLLLYLKVDPLWDSLRSDTRFKDLLQRMNFTS